MGPNFTERIRFTQEKKTGRVNLIKKKVGYDVNLRSQYTPVNIANSFMGGSDI